MFSLVQMWYREVSSNLGKYTSLIPLKVISDTVGDSELISIHLFVIKKQFEILSCNPSKLNTLVYNCYSVGSLIGNCCGKLQMRQIGLI